MNHRDGNLYDKNHIYSYCRITFIRCLGIFRTTLDSTSVLGNNKFVFDSSKFRHKLI